jgi:signal transduction histidine kinase
VEAGLTGRRAAGGWRGDLVVAAVAAVVQVGGTALAARHQADVRTLNVSGYLLLAAGPAALIARRWQPVAVLATVFAATLGYTMLDYPGGPIWLALIIAFASAVISGHRIAAYASLLAGYVSFLWLAKLATGKPGPSAGVAVGLAAWLLFLLAGSELIRNRRAYARASRQRAIEERRSAYEADRRRASEERLGIARELHDVVAHSLSLINVQSAVALELMDQRPEQARTALTAIKQASREALADVQSVLDALRRPGEEAPLAPAPSLRDVGDLVRRAEATGLAVGTRVEADLAGLPSGVGAAGYRIVQEALTNVVRHADASSASVRIGEDSGVLIIEVEDDGPGRSGDQAGRGGSEAGGGASSGGSGIRGMRERAAALGGEVTAGRRTGGGWRVRARLPLGTRPGEDAGPGGSTP